ncbi:nucleotidyltransferase-like protein [Paenibacillus bouchesdurhonensis]|uniref:nucleotidyltransferase-like protein n=1 Tax=Paenibacillus bouchesdurhonensis TaxID=1870990 RepID=UPI000DA6337C|nr:nucleotidyltransferase-like protein [Paenibacillus bouchesdurhonensis]
MEPTIYSLVDEDSVGRQALGAIGYRHNSGEFHSSLIYNFELVVITVCEGMNEAGIEIEHCTNGDMQYQLLYIGNEDLKRWVMTGENREIVQCFLHGEIIWDVEGELARLCNEIIEFGEGMREQRKFIEFAKFLKMYIEAKRYTQDLDFLDAYYNVLQALKHYARIELIEQGILPESSVWEQVRPLNSVVYKLFDELTDNKETLEQRIQLVLLACEFTIISKMSDCCSVLLRILSSRKDAWSIQELRQLPELEHVREEVPMLLRKLVYHSLAYEVTSEPKGSIGEEREIKYLAGKF